MLQPIEQPKPTNYDEVVASWFDPDRDAVAKCPETGAKLLKSRKQWTLVIEQDGETVTRHWSRRKANFEMALERANKVLARLGIE